VSSSSKQLVNSMLTSVDTVPTYFVSGGACQHLICLTADVQAFKGAYGDDAQEVVSGWTCPYSCEKLINLVSVCASDCLVMRLSSTDCLLPVPHPFDFVNPPFLSTHIL
jgi:hypothetical protein